MANELKRDPTYRRASINELEAIYAGADSSIAILNALALELTYRSTDRAGRLQSRISADLAEGSDPQPGLDLGNDETLPVRDQEYAPTPSSRKPASSAPEPTPVTASTPPVADGLPPLVDLEDLPTMDLPQVDNDPAAILSAWTAFEALDPLTFRRPFDLVGGDRKRIVDLKGAAVPWPGGRSIPNYKLFYQVPLGTIGMAKATQALVNAFDANEELNPRQTERAVMAAVLIDRDGVPLEENSIAISSLTWALPEVLNGNLNSLGAWAKIERPLVEALSKILLHRDADGDIMPLTRARIDLAHHWLIRQFNLNEDMVEPAAFAIRKYHYFKSKEPPEVDLLNSFFLHDLERARSGITTGTAPEGLRRYLGIDKPQSTPDLLADNAAVEQAVAPAMTTPCRWPSPGGFPLVLLQQAAVNLARNELANGEGIISVNGPPGTGKTTLLRDVVAGCILDRAKAMAAFSDPVRAFTPSGQKLAMGGNAFFHIYKLDPSMKGHEIVVASSNNKAVENVSRELPALDAIGREIEDFSYLRTLSNRVHAPPIERVDDRSQMTPPPEADTWGMIAAVLGNAKNRGVFVQSFWWDQDCGLQAYLKAVQGKPTVREIRDENGNVVKRETPMIVTRERPPNPDEAKRNWAKARRKFQTILKEVEEDLASLEKVRGAVRNLSSGQAQRKAACLKHEDVLQKARECANILLEQRSVHSGAQEIWAAAEDAVGRHDAHRPGFFVRLFRMQRFRAWRDARDPLLKKRTAAAAERSLTERNVLAAQSAHQQETKRLHEMEQEIAELDARISKLEASLSPWRERLGNRIVDHAFFEQGHETSNLEAPWISDELHRKREEVFVAAIELHRAFVDATAQKIQHNIAVLMKAFQDGTLPDKDKRALLPDLWSTLFSIVPVISTTFASVDRMMGDLPSGSIGWLLVDEAGQAAPQAAVGAIMRAKRTIVVGDPLQIPPVVTLPDRLVELIATEFRIDPSAWAAPAASTQTVADRASRHQGEFRGEIEPRRVGVPLLVHRRCQEPMFGVSNEIAYDRQMVHAAGPFKPGPVTDALGRSRWFDIDGDAETKWCPAEGDCAVRLLGELVRKGVLEPDLFIITPFRDVANGIRSKLRNETGLFEALGVDVNEWLSNRIGTIHTVQGREAEAVILLLGAPSSKHGGARMWAGSTPNILNVAVSRAKQSLYVIGSHGAWSGVGHARTMANALPIAEKKSSAV